MPYITTGGITIHYERTGGKKPPIILCHGITDNGQCWPRLAPALKDRFDLIMLDARAHGQSDAPETGYNYDIMADDVANVIQALGVRQPAVIGHSMGAATAAVLGARHPDLVGRLVLEDPPWRAAPQSPEERAAHAETWRSSIVARKPMTQAQMIEYEVKNNPGLAVWDKSEFGPWSKAKKQVSLNILQLLQSPAPRWQDVVARISCPTLLIIADPAKGGIVTPEVAQQAAEANSKITIAAIANAGHNIRRESFEAYLSAVSGFLGQ